MVETEGLIETETPSNNGVRVLPAFVQITAAEMQRLPSPGTQRALRAETGKDYMALVGEDADSADRTQTQIWTKLRQSMPGLRWDECADIELEIADLEVVGVDPTRPANFGSSQPSAVSGE
jgi:hypothetical protein